MRNIITRAGEDTKIVICGDISQIDADDLDEYTNGLVFAAESMKGSPACAQVVFDKEDCVRSRLASEALLRMK
jgi:PhoH-like ATPase